MAPQDAAATTDRSARTPRKAVVIGGNRIPFARSGGA